MCIIGGAMKSIEYMHGVAEPDKPGEVLGLFVLGLTIYLIFKIVVFLKEANLIKAIPFIGKKINISEETFDDLLISARLWKIIILITAALIAYDQVVNEDLINLELQICLVVIAGFEIIDECYDFAIDRINKK